MLEQSWSSLKFLAIALITLLGSGLVNAEVILVSDADLATIKGRADCECCYIGDGAACTYTPATPIVGNCFASNPQNDCDIVWGGEEIKDCYSLNHTLPQDKCKAHTNETFVCKLKTRTGFKTASA